MSVRQGPHRERGPSAGGLLSGLVLGVCNAVAAFWLSVALLLTPRDEHDRDAQDGAGTGALFTIGCAAAALLLTLPAVRKGWLRWGWFVPPVVMSLMAAGRYGWLVYAYDPW